jgi:hypothetical protein
MFLLAMFRAGGRADRYSGKTTVTSRLRSEALRAISS